MHEIIELSESLSNKIAAGEVVERPSSVVKELLENAIDAGSTIIEVDVKEAGLSEIRVIDNGKGIGKEDVLLAFKRHATSKIKDENDLFRIRTLGFRGEALPSIASVSAMELITAQKDQPGTRVVIEGGKVIVQEKAPSRQGTDITISNLFYNTPARLKYLKSIHTEIGHISDVVNRIAMAHPKISIRLRHNDKILLQTNGKGEAKQVLAAIYGMNIAKKMLPIQSQSLDFSVSGYISLPEITRASRNYISIMINGRFVKNYAVNHAIIEGYHTLLPINRYPIVMVNIEMDPILVDVNVHPAKLEVRISKEKELQELVTATIKEVFHEQVLIPDPVVPKIKLTRPSEQTTLTLEHENKAPHIPVKEESTTSVEQVEEQETYIDHIQVDQDEIKATVQTIYEEKDKQYGEASIEKKENDRIPVLYPIGQLHGTYIMAQNEKGLYIIDQHAAQERIKYEYYRDKVGQVENILQDMLIPLTLEFSTDECLKLKEYKEDLQRLGIYLEEFGLNSFIIRSHPNWFPKDYIQETIEDIINQLLKKNYVNLSELFEEAAIMMSCKGSIKANHYLRLEDMQELLDELRRAEEPFTCPHGRPIIVHFTSYDLEKMFKRVM